MNAHKRDRRAPNAGHVAAILVAALMFGFLAGLTVFGYARNGLTPSEIAAGAAALAVLIVAVLWLHRERRQRGRGQQ